MNANNRTGSVTIARVLYVLGTAMAAGTLVDVGILWIGQRQSTTQWEFVALVNTLEGLSGLMLAFAVVFAGMWIDRKQRPTMQRVAGGLMILTGIAAAGMGGLLTMDYLALRSTSGGASGSALLTTSLKGILLSLVYFGAMGSAGMVAQRVSTESG